jgi:hypothetical protein
MVLPGCIFERFPYTYERFPCEIPEVRMPEFVRLSREEWFYLLRWLLLRKILKHY